MNLIYIIINIWIWFICDCVIFCNYVDEIIEADGSFKKITAIIVMALTGPILVLNNLIIQVLDCVLPEGWDD